MEQWVYDWISAERKSGKKGVEVKLLNGAYYVYQSTTYWVRVQPFEVSPDLC